MADRKHTVDAPKMNWGPDEIWMATVARHNDAARIQGLYQMYKREVKNPMHNAMPRETLAQRRVRVEGVAHSLKV